ncbi:hypothetical protein F5Y08DRAFT_86667 [Xylaria arbuscula]|nr:hypothetical protein F5Y08DRAFT_86667 [Xylaria arbuscula]
MLVGDLMIYIFLLQWSQTSQLVRDISLTAKTNESDFPGTTGDSAGLGNLPTSISSSASSAHPTPEDAKSRSLHAKQPR